MRRLMIQGADSLLNFSAMTEGMNVTYLDIHYTKILKVLFTIIPTIKKILAIHVIYGSFVLAKCTRGRLGCCKGYTP